MSALLRIAPELRDMILQEVLFQSPREPPTSPETSQNRTRRRYSEDAKCSDGHDIWVERTPYFAAASSSSSSSSSSRTKSSSALSSPTSVLLVNRQLYHEAAGILARRRLRYRLDVMYVKECGLWPTWLELPRLARRVDEIHATFRVFDPPSDVNPDWRNPRQLVAGDGGPPMVVWNFFALLKDYLRYGPSAFEALVARPAPASSEPFTVNRLVLDVLPPPPDSPAARDDSLGFPRSRLAADRHMLDAFARGRHAKYWPLPPDAFPHLMVAEKMAFFIAAKIAGLLAMYDDYGRCLYEHVGSIEVRVAGHPRRTFDLDELMGMLPPTPIQAHSPAATARKQKAFDEWKAATVARRAAWT